MCGLGIGLVGAIAAGRLIEHHVWHPQWTDPATYAGVAALLAVVALAATPL